MSEEEKKAIKELTEIKELVEEDLRYKDYEATAILDQIDLESLIIVLNLIEKQQKEIEHWKVGIKIIEKDKNNHIEKLERRIEELFAENQSLKYANENMIHKDIVRVNYTPNDKIKAKIEEINKEMLNEENSLELFYRKKYCKEVLQLLLER